MNGKRNSFNVKRLLIVLFCLAASVISVNTVFAQAKGKPFFQTPIGAMLSGSRTVTWYVTRYGYTSPGVSFYNYRIGLPTDTRTMKVSQLKSSRPKVVSVSVTENDDRSTSITCVPKRAGTATISFRVKVSGKTYRYQLPYTVIKYANPAKTFKIGSVNYASRFKKSGHYIIGKKFSGKLTIVPKKGWVLDSLYIFTESDDAEPEECMTMYKYKQGMKIRVKKGQKLCAVFRNYKGVLARCSLYS